MTCEMKCRVEVEVEVEVSAVRCCASQELRLAYLLRSNVMEYDRTR